MQTENKSDKGSFLILVDFFPKEVEWSVQELRLLANLNSFSPFHFPFGDLSLISNSSEFHGNYILMTVQLNELPLYMFSFSLISYSCEISKCEKP